MTIRTPYFDDSPLAFCLVGTRYPWSLSNKNQTNEIPSGRDYLLHEVGKSRTLGKNHGEKH